MKRSPSTSREKSIERSRSVERFRDLAQRAIAEVVCHRPTIRRGRNRPDRPDRRARLVASRSVTAATGATPRLRAPYPTLRLERRLWDAGDTIVCGIDEVGRGAWAGPVTVAAVVPPPEHLKGIRDSKQLTRGEREVAASKVRSWAVAYGIGHASHEECDELGMTAALRAAGLRALAQLDAQGYVPDRIVLDGNYDYLGLGSRVTTVIKGDASCLAV